LGARFATRFAVVATPSLIVVEPCENRRAFYVHALSAAGHEGEAVSSMDAAFTLTAAAGTFLIVRLSTLGHSPQHWMTRAVLAGLRPIVLIPDHPYTTLEEQLQWCGATAVVVGTWNVEAVLTTLASLISTWTGPERQGRRRQLLLKTTERFR
jgi:hypothetical protein